MTGRRPSVLSTEQYSLLMGLANSIVPETQEMPAAGEVIGDVLAAVLRARPDLVAPLQRVLESVSESDPERLLDALEDDAPADLEVVLQVVLGAYYMHPDVWRLIGYGGQEAHTLPRGGFGAEDLVAEMMDSPARYRRVSP